MQLFSPWRSADLEKWIDTKTCIEEYQKRQDIVSIVRGKTFPFSMNEVLDEMKIHEAMNNISDEIKDR